MAKKVLPFITLLCVVVMVVAVLMIVGEVKDRQKEIDDFDKLSDLVADVTVHYLHSYATVCIIIIEEVIL